MCLVIHMFSQGSREYIPFGRAVYRMHVLHCCFFFQFFVSIYFKGRWFLSLAGYTYTNYMANLFRCLGKYPVLRHLRSAFAQMTLRMLVEHLDIRHSLRCLEILVLEITLRKMQSDGHGNYRPWSMLYFIFLTVHTGYSFCLYAAWYHYCPWLMTNHGKLLLSSFNNIFNIWQFIVLKN